MLKKRIAIIALMGIMSVGVAQAQADKRPEYGTNILRLSPITVNDMGVGFSLSYEKILGKEQKVGIIFPFAILLEDVNYYDPLVDNSGVMYNAYFSFQPGLKIYPFGQRKVTYAVGPSLCFTHGGGERWENTWDPDFSKKVEVRKTRIGMLVNNYVNFQITNNFNLGLEAGLGMTYYDAQSVDESRYNYGFNVAGQFAMTIGYRF